MPWNTLLNALPAPLIAWIGYVHTTRPSRKECELRHDKECARFDAICSKLTEIQETARENNRLLISHITRHDE